MHDLLFANQKVWENKPDFDAYATQIGLNLPNSIDEMNDPMSDRTHQSRYRRGNRTGQESFDQGLISKDEADNISVNGTPAIFVDGKKLISFQHQSTWRAIMANPVPPWQPERRPRPCRRGPASPEAQIRPRNTTEPLMTNAPVPSSGPSGWWPTLGTPLAMLLCLLGLATSAVLLQHHLAVAIGSNPLLGGVCAMTAAQ